MANVIDMINNVYIKPYKRIILIIALIILFVIAGYFAYIWYAVPKIDKKPYDDIANVNRRNKSADIFFFHADWCPHCKAAQPEWTTFHNKYDKQVVNGYIINCNDVNCTNSDDPAIQASIQQFKVEHFPTVKMMKDDYTVDFDAKISAESLEKFITAVTNS